MISHIGPYGEYSGPSAEDDRKLDAERGHTTIHLFGIRSERDKAIQEHNAGGKEAGD